MQKIEKIKMNLLFDLTATQSLTLESAVLKYPEKIKGLVSIIIPIYNTAPYLREALDSVIAQTFKNWEGILVNDGSTDNSSEICIEYVEKDSRFKYICKERNEGLLLARKTGLENSKGEFIANLDSDDFYLPQFLEKMFDKITARNNDFVWCDIDNSEGIPTTTFSENKLENCLNISKVYRGAVWNKLIKRSIYIKVLFPKAHFTNGEDYFQILQILYHSKQAEFVSDIFSFYRRDNYSTSRPLSLKAESFIARCTFGGIIFYLLAKHFFNANEAERFFAEIACFYFRPYFLLNKKAIIRNRMEYAENFVPAFLRGLKKTKEITFRRKFHRATLIWACKGFPLPFRIYYNLQEIKKRALKWFDFHIKNKRRKRYEHFKIYI